MQPAAKLPGVGQRPRRAADWPARAVFVASALPILWLGGRALLGDLGPNPIAEVLNRLGLYTLTVLLAPLACTPLHIVFGWKWPLRVRRLLGLWSFAYASLHLVTYAVLDQGLDASEIWKDVVKRKFVTSGFAAFVLLAPLAVTSTSGWVKRLGFRRWKLLHRLAYVAGVLGCIHFLWRFKLTEPQPLAYGAVLLLLFAIRILGWLREGRAGERRRPSTPRPRPV